MYESNTGKFLYQFFREREGVFIELKENLDSKIDEEDIHNLRRSGKRVKAIIHLLGEIDESFKPQKRFLPIRDIFNSAGAFREVQVNIRTLKTYDPSKDLKKAYSKFIFTRQELLKADLIYALSCFDAKKHKNSIKKVKELCKVVDNKQVINSSLNYIKRKLDEITRFFTQESNEENVHNIRITFKKITPVANLLYPLKVEGFEEDLIITIKNAEDRLGHWHDRVILNESLKGMLKKSSLENNLSKEIKGISKKLSLEHETFIVNLQELIIPVIEKLGNLVD